MDRTAIATSTLFSSKTGQRADLIQSPDPASGCANPLSRG